MLKYSVFLLCMLLFSCTKKVEEKSESKRTIAKYSIENEPNKEKTLESKYNPSKEFQKLVVDLNKKNLISDVQRLEKVNIYKELSSENITYFNNYPFYWIPFHENMIFKSKNIKSTNSYLVNLDINVFAKTKGVWGYYYRDKNAKEIIYDGVIEQWKFSNKEEALDALNELRKSGLIIYFNTNPFFCRIENDVFIFHTRAMSFSYEQKSVFDKFVQDNNA